MLCTRAHQMRGELGVLAAIGSTQRRSRSRCPHCDSHVEDTPAPRIDPSLKCCNRGIGLSVRTGRSVHRDGKGLSGRVLVPFAEIVIDGVPFAERRAGEHRDGRRAAVNPQHGKQLARLDIVDLGSMTVTSSVEITDGYHNRIDMSSNGQLFIGSYNCTTIGNVNNPQGEVRGCLSIFNTTKAGNTTAIIPPDNGDVTAFQSFTSRDAEYVAEGGNLRVYDTTTDILLVNSFISTGTVTITGKIIDVKAIDFF